MEKPLVETELADSEPQRRPGPWKLIVIVVILTLIGVWLVPDGDPTMVEQTADEPGQAAEPPDSAPSLLADAPVETANEILSMAPPSAGPEIVDDRPGARARALIASMRAAGDINLDRVFAAAQQSQGAGDLPDAYLLYFFAAREGHTGAALELGKQADPASRDPLNSVFEAPDLNQAYKWYRSAAGNGDELARQHLADLHARVEQLAASGDPQAQRTSLLWQ